MIPLSPLAEYDQAVAKVTQVRGNDYGRPSDNFRRLSAMRAIIDECPDAVLREVLHMEAVKICRLIETPDHLDSWVDVAGYARVGVMILEERDSD
jgi:hypothetical protein